MRFFNHLGKACDISARDGMLRYIFGAGERTMYSHKIILLQNLKNQIMTTNLWVEQVIYRKRSCNVGIKEGENRGIIYRTYIT